MESPEEYMLYAIELAKKGRGFTSPNPMVGAVIVKNGKIIGSGWHKKYGDWHAEVNAFNSCTESPEGADMYVTLEPCAHYGKTPPCALAVVKHGIKRVFVGMTDPNPLVAGKGIKIMEDAGITVETGICEKECKALNPIFLKYITQKTPYVVMKTAMTFDGKIAAYTGNSQWVSCEESRREVQQLRHDLKGIMVGINTVLADDPALTCRIEKGIDPVRIIVDSTLKIPLSAKVLNDSNCIIATTEKADPEKKEKLEKAGITVLTIPTFKEQVDLNILMEELGKLKIDSILLEGGGTLCYSAIRAGIVDKVIAYIAPKIVGGSNAKTPVEGKGIKKMSDAVQLYGIQVSTVGTDIKITAYTKEV